MTHDDFWKFFATFVAELGAKMGEKSKEYARGDNKLHNFTRAGEIDRCSPLRALRGMQLKHTVSLEDMRDDFEKGQHHSKAEWREKTRDRVAYDLLAFAQLHDSEGWEVGPCTDT